MFAHLGMWCSRGRPTRRRTRLIHRGALLHGPRLCLRQKAMVQNRRGEGSVVSDAELVGPLRKLLQRAGLALSLALVLGATLRPVGGQNHVVLAPWASRQLTSVNVLGNVALFALPSAVLWSFGWSLGRTVVAGFVISLGIELLQFAVPGRTTATADVLCNVAGAAAGWLVAASFGRRW